MTNHSTPKTLSVAPFFFLRTPLLPYAIHTQLINTCHLAEKTNLEDMPTDVLNSIIEQDRARLRTQLKQLLKKPVVQEAIASASLGVSQQIAPWCDETSKMKEDARNKLDYTFVKYLHRMSTRSTPFGLLAGCSFGHIQDTRSDIQLASIKHYKRHVRLDYRIVYAIYQTLIHNPKIKRALNYRLNETLYFHTQKYRYIERGHEKTTSVFEFVKIKDHDALKLIIKQAEKGVHWSSLLNTLTQAGHDNQDAEEFIDTLIDDQILISTCGPVLTRSFDSPDALLHMIACLQEQQETKDTAKQLMAVAESIKKITCLPLGANHDYIEPLRQQLKPFLNDSSVQPAIDNQTPLLQTDLYKPTQKSQLSAHIIKDIQKAMVHLSRMTKNTADPLSEFKHAFDLKYEQRMVPLLELIDGDMGLMHTLAERNAADTHPFLDKLSFQIEQQKPLTLSYQEQYMLRRVQQLTQTKKTEQDILEWSISADDWKQLHLTDEYELQSHLYCLISIAHTQNGQDIWLQHAGGPPATHLLNRFSYINKELHAHIQKYHQEEESLATPAVLADIVHLSNPVSGNFSQHLHAYRYEIPFLAHCSTSNTQAIALKDLYVYLEDNRVKLYSWSLKRPVIPRMMTAENPLFDRHLALFRFFSYVSYQDMAAYAWPKLNYLPFVPRIRDGKIIFSLATWNLSKLDYWPIISAKTPATLMRELRQMRLKLKIPRVVNRVESDLKLPMDLDHIVSAEEFKHVLKNKEHVTLEEIWPPQEQLWIKDEEQHRYAHEIVLCLNQKDKDHAQNNNTNLKQTDQAPEHLKQLQARCELANQTKDTAIVKRFYVPKDTWAYVKIYTHPNAADTILTDSIAPLLSQLNYPLWFFIRYQDPDFHLRVRIHESNHYSAHTLMSLISDCLNPLVQQGLVVKFVFDTYSREIERYGGAHLIGFCEQLFFYCSQQVLELINLIKEQQEENQESDWHLIKEQIALLGMQSFIHDLFMDFFAEHAFIQQMQKQFLKKYHATPNQQLPHQLSDIHRQLTQQNAWQMCFDFIKSKQQNMSFNSDHLPSWFIQTNLILKKRTEHTKDILLNIKKNIPNEQTTGHFNDLVASLVHMFVNRLMISRNNDHELMLYDFLNRIYNSIAAKKSPKDDPI